MAALIFAQISAKMISRTCWRCWSAGQPKFSRLACRFVARRTAHRAHLAQDRASTAANRERDIKQVRKQAQPDEALGPVSKEEVRAPGCLALLFCPHALVRLSQTLPSTRACCQPTLHRLEAVPQTWRSRFASAKRTRCSRRSPEPVCLCVLLTCHGACRRMPSARAKKRNARSAWRRSASTRRR